MTQTEMIAVVARECNLSKTAVSNVLNVFGQKAQQELRLGDKVYLFGLGVMRAEQKPERMGRNPKTGEAITIAAKVVIQFSMSKACREHLNARLV